MSNNCPYCKIKMPGNHKRNCPKNPLMMRSAKSLIQGIGERKLIAEFNRGKQFGLEIAVMAICRFCASGNKPKQTGAYWNHALNEGIASCYAAEIHELICDIKEARKIFET